MRIQTARFSSSVMKTQLATSMAVRPQPRQMSSNSVEQTATQGIRGLESALRVFGLGQFGQIGEIQTHGREITTGRPSFYKTLPATRRECARRLPYAAGAYRNGVTAPASLLSCGPISSSGTEP